MTEARCDADGLSARHTQMRRRVRQLYNGYRGLRYKMEDEWPSGTGARVCGFGCVEVNREGGARCCAAETTTVARRASVLDDALSTSCLVQQACSGTTIYCDICVYHSSCLCAIQYNTIHIQGAAPPRVAHEDAVIGGSADDLLRCVCVWSDVYSACMRLCVSSMSASNV